MDIIMYNISKEESDRIRIIKFIAIILVYIFILILWGAFSDVTNTLYLPVWLYLVETGISQIVASYSVPIFFLLSSILLFDSEGQYRTVIKKKARTLLLPYLIWNTFWIAVFIVLQLLPFTTAYFLGIIRLFYSVP